MFNPYMHPRNIYKIPPSFKDLAKKYHDFGEFVKCSDAGKYYIDFKNVKALRSLTVTLLKNDFDINLEIPLNHLIPTISLRLNYLLWIEDLLSVCDRNDPIQGIDIGTGSSCIYPLLAAKKNKWLMLGTDVDPESLAIAHNNICINPNLQSFITLKLNDSNTILLDIIDRNCVYDFSMCNPPFFSSTEDLDFQKKSRSLNRPKPKNAFAASFCETITNGGEVAFINKMIEESMEIASNIRIYTTMIGQKKNLIRIKTQLRNNSKIISYKETEFCQGNTVRWGLAWTYCDIDLRSVPEYFKSKRNKKHCIFRFEVQLNASGDNVNVLLHAIENYFLELKIGSELITKKLDVIIMRCNSYEDTWSHQRRKRRQLEQTEKNNCPVDEGVILMPVKRSLEELGQRSFYRFASVKRRKLALDVNPLRFMLNIRHLGNEAPKFEVQLELISDDDEEYNREEASSEKRQMLHGVFQYLKNKFSNAT